MLHPATKLAYVNEEIGLGVFATEFIPKGTILWVYDGLDLSIPAEKVEKLPEIVQKPIKKYGYKAVSGEYYTLNWDITRYLNHSCRPASRSVNDYMDIAVRDIKAGEQITVEYGILNYTDLVCKCGEPNCRGVIRATDCLHYYKEWDREIREALDCMKSVPQPLYELAMACPECREIVQSYPDVKLRSSRDFYIGK